jgi:intein/homing endonuclease
MYKIRAKCLGEVTLTPEHPVLIARRAHPKRHNEKFELIWERADQIHKGDYLAYPIPAEVVPQESLQLPSPRRKIGAAPHCQSAFPLLLIFCV